MDRVAAQHTIDQVRVHEHTWLVTKGGEHAVVHKVGEADDDNLASEIDREGAPVEDRLGRHGGNRVRHAVRDDDAVAEHGHFARTNAHPLPRDIADRRRRDARMCRNELGKKRREHGALVLPRSRDTPGALVAVEVNRDEADARRRLSHRRQRRHDPCNGRDRQAVCHLPIAQTPQHAGRGLFVVDLIVEAVGGEDHRAHISERSSENVVTAGFITHALKQATRLKRCCYKDRALRVGGDVVSESGWQWRLALVKKAIDPEHAWALGLQRAQETGNAGAALEDVSGPTSSTRTT